jgi:tetratricopeptide (TPR) repeat protein
VGYHEWRGGENSHLRQAVRNLYSRWLKDASMVKQARIMYEQNKSELVPIVGKLFGFIFDKLAGSLGVPDKIGDIVAEAFNKLAEAQRSLVTGGLPSVSLPYDEAQSLLSIVSKISQKRIILILDAWEKPEKSENDIDALESFLKHMTEWPVTHMFLAIRYPDLTPNEAGNSARRQAKKLRLLNPAAMQVCELAQLDLKDPAELSRVCSFLQRSIRVARGQACSCLLELVDGFPGVIDFWLHAETRGALHTFEDLVASANDAQVTRYSEIPMQLEHLTPRTLQFAGAMVFLPQLDAQGWRDVTGALADHLGAVRETYDELTDCGLLLGDQEYASFGHETRFRAIRTWFIQERTALFRRIGTGVIKALASRLSGDRIKDSYLLAAIGASSDVVMQLELSAPIEALVNSARSLILDDPTLFTYADESLCESLAEASPPLFTITSMALNARGIHHGHSGKFSLALQDFAKAASRPVPSTDLRVRVRKNLALVRSVLGDIQGAISDYSAAIDVGPDNYEQLADAYYGRASARGQVGDLAGAICDYSFVIDHDRSPVLERTQSLCNRGLIKAQLRDLRGAIDDYSIVCNLADAPLVPRLKCFSNRAFVRMEVGDSDDAIADYTNVIQYEAAPVDEVARALTHRAFVRVLVDDVVGAMADNERVALWDEAPVVERARALNNLGDIYAKKQRWNEAVAAFSAAIEIESKAEDLLLLAQTNRNERATHVMSDGIGDLEGRKPISLSLVSQTARALRSRADSHKEQGQIDAAIADYTDAITLPFTTLVVKRESLIARGLLFSGDKNDKAAAMADFTAVIEEPNVPDEQGLAARYYRACAAAATEELAAAESDYTFIINSDSATTAILSRALNNRGVIRHSKNDIAGALEDYSRVVDMQMAPGDALIRALLNRAGIYVELGRTDASLADLEAGVVLTDVPLGLKVKAILTRGKVKRETGDIAGAIADFQAVIECPDGPPELALEAEHQAAAIHTDGATSALGQGARPAPPRQ